MKTFETTTVPCRICGNPTPMTGTKLCDRCWELEGRIHRDPELAKKILAALEDNDDDIENCHCGDENSNP